MMSVLPRMDEPAWLAAISDEELGGAFPLSGLLDASLYYPCAGFDGDPVARLAGNFYSFVYVDYGVSREDLGAELRIRGFRGYEVIARRSVGAEELTPDGWTPTPPTPEDGDPSKYQRWFKSPFCEWLIFQRIAAFDEDHGPRRFSLLYLCADGVAAYQALYIGNRLRPLGVAIIQPGTGFGFNWTDFENPEKIFARTVRSNPAGVPEILLYGGSGGRDFYTQPCWPEYAEGLGFLGNTSIGVWRRRGRQQ